MITSKKINELASALSKAQGEMGAAIKDADNLFFKSKYADLGAVIKAIKEPFARHGLSYTQHCIRQDREAGVITRLMHSSGQFMQSEYTIPLGKFDAQSVGSAFTYARRYALQAIAGVPADDDDGNSAAQAAPEEPTPKERHDQALADNLQSVNAIKEFIATEKWESLAEAWQELDDEAKKDLWLASTKGGVFTPAERKALKCDEFNAARKAMFSS